MYKFLCILLFAGFAACNSSPETRETSSSNAAKGAPGWARNDEMEFLDACVENSAERLGEEQAFNTCKCILRQIQEKNPENDSAKVALMITDTAQMKAMADKCR